MRSDLAQSVHQVLETFVHEEIRTLVSLDAALQPLATTAAEAVLSPGKRIRPVFAFWGWRAATPGYGSPAGVLPALAALELLHAFAVVHDDIMDRSDTRRGHPTAHRRFYTRHREQRFNGDPHHFGASMGILVGDLCLVWADRLMASANLPADALLRARTGYDRMRVETIAGQFLDVLGEASPVWSPARAMRTAQLKTAAYTVTRPLEFGARLTGPLDDGLQRCFTRYGEAVGVAFQLRDDLLGLYGDPAVTGKPRGEDIGAGRPTVTLELARELGSPGQVQRLQALLREPEPDVATIVALIEQTGAVERVEQMIVRRLRTAHDALADAPIDAPCREALANLAATAAWRNS